MCFSKQPQLLVMLLLYGLCVVLVQSEVFSALATLTQALQSEKEVAGALRDYVQREKERLDQVLRIADEYDRHADVALVNPESYIANPINAYMFVKKFTTELPTTKELLQSTDNVNIFLDKLSQLNSTLPDDEDLNGVVAAVLRLQDTYQLSASKITDGSFTPINQSPPMSAMDCFQFGLYAHKQMDYYHTVIWMQEAYDKLDKGENSVSKASVLDYLSYALYNQGNFHHARFYIEKWLKLEPDHERAKRNLIIYNNKITKENDELVSRGMPAISDDVLPPIKNNRVKHKDRERQEFQEYYEALCRDKDVKSNPSEHELKCYYSTGQDSPNLLLAPVKVEEFYLDPMILVYHDIVSEKEIEIVKEIAKPKLKRATVHKPGTEKLVTAPYRISRTGWLGDTENETIAAISQRLSAAGHLSIERAEYLQIQNYGIGGQYEPHFDFIDKRDMSGSPIGNRVATGIFYFTDVDAGGLTVFTSLGVKVPPKKGTAAFWYNLRKSGEKDWRTRHAGCPVLAGSKWVANKWFRERDQVFMRPCGLSPDE